VGRGNAGGIATRYGLDDPANVPTLPSVAINFEITGNDRLWILVSHSYHSARWNPIRVTGNFLV